MKNSYKVLVVGLVALVVVFGFFLGSIAGNHSQQAVANTIQSTSNTIRVGYLPTVQSLPWYLAIEKGYFKDAGINVDFVSFNAPNQIIDALMQDQIDFSGTSGAAGITGIAEFKNPGKIEIYGLTGGTKEIPSNNLVVPVDSDIKSFADLKGKKLGILGGSIQWRTISKDLVTKAGLDADGDVTLVELTPALQVQALASKQIDALIALEPVTTIIKSQKVGKVVISGAAEQFISDPFYPGAGAVNVEFVKHNSKLAEQVVNIISRAVDEINTDPDLVRKYLGKYTSINDNLAANVPLCTFKMYNNFTASDLDSLQKFYDIFTQYKVVDGKINARGFLCASKQ